MNWDALQAMGELVALDYLDREGESPNVYLADLRRDDEFRLHVIWKRNQTNTQRNKLHDLFETTEDVLSALSASTG